MAFSASSTTTFEDHTAASETLVEEYPTLKEIRHDSLAFTAYFDIKNIAECLHKHEYKRVALQFPDELLSYSSQVVTSLRSAVEALNGSSPVLFVLADTSYGSCCVDEVAASHLQPDVVIHFGKSCLSLTSHYPVIHCFGRERIDVDDCAQKFLDLFSVSESGAAASSPPVVVMYDVVYSHCIENLLAIVHSRSAQLPCLLFSRVGEYFDPKASNSIANGMPVLHCTDYICRSSDSASVEGDSSTSTATEWSHHGRIIPPIPQPWALADCRVFFIGGEGRTLTNLMMTWNRCQFFTYNPVNKEARQESWNVNRALMRRFYMLQKAKDAQVIGILVGTLGVSSYVSVMEKIKQLIRARGRKYYTFVVGKLNVPKLANFPEVDIFVLVACHENSLIDSKDFYRPVVTPFELTHALSSTEDWTGEYATDFKTVLSAMQAQLEKEVDEESLEPRFSLVSGRLIQYSNLPESDVDSSTEESNNESSSLIKRSEDSQVIKFESAAAQYLANRSFKGLETEVDADLSLEVKEGRSGIARGYSHEPGLDSENEK